MAKEASARRKKRLGWLIPVGIVVIIALFGLVVFAMDAPARQEIAEMPIGEVRFTNLQDGVYTGTYSGTKNELRDVALEVTVQDGSVECVRILRGALDSEGNPAELNGGITAQDFLQTALDAQSLQVDAVSGATLTSKTLLKALENALRQAN